MKNFKNTNIVLSLLLCSLTMVGCSNSSSESASVSSEENGHNWVEGEVIKEADCGSPKVVKYTCTSCSKTKEVAVGKASGNHSLKDHVCSTCGYIDMSSLSLEEAINEYGYYHVDKDASNTISNSDSIFFGSYPQDQVKDNSLISSLTDALVDSSWNSYSYSLNNEVSDYMKYQDITFEGKKYRAMKASSLRPYQIDVSSDYNFMSQNGYETNTTYFFEFKPLEWLVLDYFNNKATLQSLHAIDSQSYSSTYTKDGGNYLNSDKTYVNNWETSYIRSFLNDKFYDWAFDSTMKSKILTTSLDNKTTSYSLNNEYAKVQNDTEDKVFLLSYQDTLNERYQFPNVESEKMSGEANGSLLACKSGTDYSLSQGLRISNQTQNADNEPCSYWILRSAGGKNYSICGISKYGTISKSNSVTYTPNSAKEQDGTCFYTAEGIVPALTLNLGR